jgi:SPP1 family predicted phage head-tail adaptor
MRSGKLDRRITIERQTETVTASGAVTKSWGALATVRAELIQQSTEEFLTGFGEAENGTVVFRIRYLASITTADRVIFDSAAYGLKEVTEIGRRRVLELRAVKSS